MMEAEAMDSKYVRIAELTENIDKLNQLIALHTSTTKSGSMIKQYAFKRDEFIAELRELFKSLNLTVEAAVLA